MFAYNNYHILLSLLKLLILLATIVLKKAILDFIKNSYYLFGIKIPLSKS
ncbi:hypothetical protein A1OE_1392 [Candidatus Endolissoclinum faulkneri L2]|uniref:Uncharacterized protein n=1 Tax=Candidatus Endolissoclinum faulkneri L2 TaxID=1193729 RepID=K7ZDI8_9PROT|nr:hypothetical protein A1OE_1392 [Candidatus Endolissoclinum faulkneri L2]